MFEQLNFRVNYNGAELVRKDLREALRATRDNCVELVMKDNHTLGNNPGNITRWVQIAREEIEAL
jgi:hypothetical protein